MLAADKRLIGQGRAPQIHQFFRVGVFDCGGVGRIDEPEAVSVADGVVGIGTPIYFRSNHHSNAFWRGDIRVRTTRGGSAESMRS